MPDTSSITADIIATARLQRSVLDRAAMGIAPAGATEAYAVQSAVHALLAKTRFGARLGWKIGCTTPVMQAYLGIAHPCAAGLFPGTVHQDGASLRHDAYVRVGVECEIAVRLGRGLSQGPFTVESVRDAVDEVMAAIEIVDDRYADWRTIGTPMLIADDFFAAGAVLGKPRSPASLPDLAGLRGRTLIDGNEVGSGLGADVLGHPYAALAWLAGHALERGSPLEADEVVLLGSLVKTQWVPPGATVTVEIDGLGKVEARFA